MTKGRVTVRLKFEPSFIRNPIPDDARAKVGRRQGALIRTIARRSIRNAPKKRTKAGRLTKAAREGRLTSRPGSPPFSREGQLKKFLFYSWDPKSQSVVIGPEQLGSSDTPAVLEGTRRRRRQRGLKPRPFMSPAMMEAKNKMPELWRGAIK